MQNTHQTPYRQALSNSLAGLCPSQDHKCKLERGVTCSRDEFKKC